MVMPAEDRSIESCRAIVNAYGVAARDPTTATIAPARREQLAAMIRAAGLTVREALRQKEAVYAELGLGDETLTDDQLLDAMLRHPILINRPFVVTELGTRLCRPSEAVLDILPKPQRGFFAKEDGEVVINEKGERA